MQPATTIQDDARIERLIGMAERLVAALESDITALKAGKPAGLRTADPEIQRLTALPFGAAGDTTP